MTYEVRRWGGALAAALGLLAVTALTAYAARFGPWAPRTNVGAPINSLQNDFCAFESRSGLSLFFSSDRPNGAGGFDLYVSKRASVDSPWGPPQNIASLNTAAADACPVLLPGERELIFYSTRQGGHGLRDLYISRRHDNHSDLADLAWGPPQNLDTVNSSADDWLASAFGDDDGLTLYFASDRGGAAVLTEVYASVREDGGTFGAPVPVAELNSSYHDGWPRVRRDGLEIFVTSQRPTGPGDVSPADNDIWTATRCSTDEPWGPLAPVPQLNTGTVQSGGALSRDGTRLYLVSPTGSLGGVDIWQSTRSKLHGDDDEAACDDRRGDD